MPLDRRNFLRGAAAVALSPPLTQAHVQAGTSVAASADRVFITNEDSNTMTVIDPDTLTVATTINLTSFDEDPRSPFRLVTSGIAPTHAAMIHKPLYHGCIDAHGAAPSPDGRLIATSGRGSSNVYLIDTVALRVIGNVPNPAASPATNAERLSSGVLIGREPHEPTFTRDGRELWVTLRGEDRIAILDVERALKQATGADAAAVRRYLPTVNGPAQVWFSADGKLAFVASQKVPRLDVFRLHSDGHGGSNPQRAVTLDVAAEDPPGFTPFLKTSPDGGELWLSHKLADAVSARATSEPFALLDRVVLGAQARPNHVEFVENARGRVVYVSLARVDDRDGAPASSQIAIIDRGATPGSRKLVRLFHSGGREAHGLWTNPENSRLFVAHEQDEVPGTPLAGQTVCTAFDVTDPFSPKLMAQIPLGSLRLPSGELRNKKSINLVYVRPGHRSQTA